MTSQPRPRQQNITSQMKSKQAFKATWQKGDPGWIFPKPSCKGWGWGGEALASAILKTCPRRNTRESFQPQTRCSRKMPLTLEGAEQRSSGTIPLRSVRTLQIRSQYKSLDRWNVSPIPSASKIIHPSCRETRKARRQEPTLGRICIARCATEKAAVTVARRR